MEHEGPPYPAPLESDPRVLITDFLSHRLGVARRRLDMSQAELARLLNVDQSTVSRLERGDMQGPPWSLVLRACLHLGIEPQALMVDEPEIFRRAPVHPTPLYRSCRPISMARGRVAQHFVYLGPLEGRLPELLRHCLNDLMRLRPTIIGLSLLLIEGYDHKPTHCHAQWRNGEISFAERMEGEQLTAPVLRLKEKWERGERSVRDSREEVPAWAPHLAVDQPIDQGMIGFDFTDDEDMARDETLWWASTIAEVFNVGLRLVPPRLSAGDRGEMREIARRLTVIEERLAKGGPSSRRPGAEGGAAVGAADGAADGEAGPEGVGRDGTDGRDGTGDRDGTVGSGGTGGRHGAAATERSGNGAAGDDDGAERAADRAADRGATT